MSPKSYEPRGKSPSAGAPVRIDGKRYKFGALRLNPFYAYLHAVGQHSGRELKQDEYDDLTWDTAISAWRPGSESRRKEDAKHDHAT